MISIEQPLWSGDSENSFGGDAEHRLRGIPAHHTWGQVYEKVSVIILLKIIRIPAYYTWGQVYEKVSVKV